MNKCIILKKRPEGTPSLNNFKIVEEDDPQLIDGEILLKTLYVSVDPYLRGRMRDEESYIPPFQLDEPIESTLISEVVESRNPNFKKGQFVSGMMKWKEFQTAKGNGLFKVDEKGAPLTAYLGVLGLTGITAYLGMEKIGKPKPGESLLVSAAAGAVGSVAGQIGKLKGCTVTGIAGSDEKIKTIQEKFGFDNGINYKKEKDLAQAIAIASPGGVDIYFDNVGGETLDAVMGKMNKFGRVINCGAISLYNRKEMPTGPRYEGFLIRKSLLMQGFTVRDYAKDFGPAIKQLTTWLNEGKINYSETVVEGFESIPQAFLDLFKGKNEGKMIVKV